MLFFVKFSFFWYLFFWIYFSFSFVLKNYINLFIDLIFQFPYIKEALDFFALQLFALLVLKYQFYFRIFLFVLMSFLFLHYYQKKTFEIPIWLQTKKLILLEFLEILIITFIYIFSIQNFFFYGLLIRIFFYGVYRVFLHFSFF